MRIAPMWETENALYHFREKDRAEYHAGEKPNLKYAVLDRDFFISTWQRKDMDGIHEIFDTEKEAYNYIFDHNKSFYLDKIDALFAEKIEELNVQVIAYQFDEEKNLHVLCQRDSDRSYISWSSYYTGEKNSSFENFYNGKYDMDLAQGIRELKKRSGKEVDVNYPMVKELTSLGNDWNRNFSELANEEHDEKTWEIMTSFYNDCLKFWRKEQENYGNVSNEEVQKLALRDVSVITTNPYSPNGEKLDEKTQEKWIKNKKKQLVNTKNAKSKNLER